MNFTISSFDPRFWFLVELQKRFNNINIYELKMNLICYFKLLKYIIINAMIGIIEQCNTGMIDVFLYSDSNVIIKESCKMKFLKEEIVRVVYIFAIWKSCCLIQHRINKFIGMLLEESIYVSRIIIYLRNEQNFFFQQET